jgi:hypothetical protein
LSKKGNELHLSSVALASSTFYHSVTEDIVRVYTMEPEIQEVLGYNRNDLILYTLAMGGDYHSGIHRCGQLMAEGFAKSGMGQGLVDYWTTKDREELEAFAVTWIANLKSELTTNCHGFFASKYPALALDIPGNGFPFYHTLDLYVNPTITLWSKEHTALGGQSTRPLYQPPDILAIRKYCTTQFGWQGADLAKRFNSNLFEGVITNILYSVRGIFIFGNPYQFRYLSFCSPIRFSIKIIASFCVSGLQQPISP